MTNAHAVAARKSKQAEAFGIGIDAAFIAQLVDNFYARIRSDPVLGPVFDDRIKDWPSHLERMNTFWRSILYKSGEFSGNPMMKHVAIPHIAKPEFSHWLKLFGETLDEMGAVPAARSLIFKRAEMIAESLLMGICIHRDGITNPRKMKG
jgi:hemoglobin